MPNNKNMNYNSSRKRQIWHTIEAIEAKIRARRTWLEKLEDNLVATFGTVEFLALNVIFFAAWILINSGTIPRVKPFDPYPFIFLTMVVSLEAIILAAFVLITQNRQERIHSLREETALQIELIDEQETTKILKTLGLILKKMGVDIGSDPELQKMLQPLNQEEIEKELENQLK
ncbi:MAG: DUF1003 domain-containing protein [candidate division WWE3 bacterium]|nr:DUF1003 domain-containing protein [candidate division WWE3 bacterium]